MILLFFDGRYYACAMIDWSGRYVTAEEAAQENGVNQVTVPYQKSYRQSPEIVHNIK